MLTRTTRKTVTFKHPFSLSGIENLPPGTYTVDTEEELVPGLSFPAYCRTATFIALPSSGRGAVMSQSATIDPLELEAAQQQDAEIL